ncbi:MAG: hypothetical protein IJV65_10485 [Kiritimatiellae bacterium]|nr:hypothetical protein [Kiritimatiellia bacterium]
MKHILLRPCRAVARHCAEGARHCGAQRRPSLPRSGPSFAALRAAPSLRRVAAPVIALALCAVSAHAETVQIAGAADWQRFATRVNTGETDLNAAMVADVSLGPAAPRVGTDDRPFKGDFNGGGHELSVNWIFTDTQCAAPFASVQAAKIHDLRVTGSIVSDDKFAAGLVGRAKAETATVIERCRVSVAITLMLSGEASCGGFIGDLSDSTACRVTIRDCLFDGSLLGPSANDCGGFVGWKPHNSYLYLYSCLFAPKAVTVSAGGSYPATFSRSSSGSAKIDGQRAIYYQRQYGLAQGANASAMSAEDLAAALGDNWAVANGKAGLALFPDPPEATTTGFAYQGVLRDAQGLRLERKDHTVQFRLYENAAGGDALWGRSYPVLLDTNGLFNVALSDATGSTLGPGTPSNGLARALAEHAGTPLFLGLTVADGGNDGAEISPRQKLLAVPVASVALDAASASGDLAVAGKAASATAKVSGAATAGTLLATRDASVGGNLALGGELRGLGAFPKGAIVLWSGSTTVIPDGWKLCDGQNGTPDLRDRFVAGAGGEYAVSATGGEKTHTLTEAEMPAHRHEWVGDDALANLEPGSSTAIRITQTRYDAESSGSGASYVYGTSYVGNSQPHENRPPYYALCFIMRVR